MNFCENRQCGCSRLIPLDEASFRLSFLKEGLQDKNLGRVVVPVQLLHVPMLVTVDAANTVHAMLRQVERPAVFALVFVDVNSEGGLSQLVLTVGEAALFIVATVTRLNPIFAHLRLVLSIVVSFGLSRRSRRRCWLARVESGASLARVEPLLAEARLGLLRLEGGNFGLAIK